MPWFKVDDKFHSHIKVGQAGVSAIGLWVLAGSWCMDQLEDGFVPDFIARRLDPDWQAHAAELVDAGLWEVSEKGRLRGWRFHDWVDHQPSKEKVMADRAANAERVRRWRDEKAKAQVKGQNVTPLQKRTKA